MSCRIRNDFAKLRQERSCKIWHDLAKCVGNEAEQLTMKMFCRNSSDLQKASLFMQESCMHNQTSDLFTKTSEQQIKMCSIIIA